MENILTLGRTDKSQHAPEPVLESSYIGHLSAAAALYLSDPEKTCKDVQAGLLASHVDVYLATLESPEAMTLGLSQLLQKIEAHAASQSTGEEVRVQRAVGGSEKDPSATEERLLQQGNCPVEAPPCLRRYSRRWNVLDLSVGCSLLSGAGLWESGETRWEKWWSEKLWGQRRPE